MGEFRLSSVKLVGFRNHQLWESGLNPGLTVLIGQNAAGKTNILEAVTVAATGRSFRPYSWEDLVQEGEERAAVFLEGSRDGASFSASFMVERSGERTFSMDGAPVQPARLSRRMPVVTFVPEDLGLSKGPAEERRAALDKIGERLSSAYTKVRREYSRVVRQRNHLLRAMAAEEQIAPWSERLAEVGGALVVHRARLLSRMVPAMNGAHESMSGGEPFSVSLSTSWAGQRMSVEDAISLGREGVAQRIGRTMKEMAPEERSRGFSLVGPHKDDTAFLLEGREARSFASQGQHRTIALAWKAAEVSVVEHVTGNRPLLLLDDVMSELDEMRRASLANEVIGGAQAIVTTTNLDYFTEETIAAATVATV